MDRYSMTQIRLLACLVMVILAVPPRFGMEHPRPYALCCHHLPSAAPGAPPNYPEGKSGVGKASLVREQWLVWTEVP